MRTSFSGFYVVFLRVLVQLLNVLGLDNHIKDEPLWRTADP